MASQPDDNRHQREAEAAALALLLVSRRRYDLLALVRQQQLRTRPFRQIRPTNALASDLAAPHFGIARAWQGLLPEVLAGVNRGSVSVVDQAADRIAPVVSNAKVLFPRILGNLERWHAGQWLSRVRAATSLDVSMFTHPSDVSDATDAAVTWNRALADDQHQAIKSKLLALALTGAVGLDAKRGADDIITKARRRAGAIGVDQTFKTSRAMDRGRREAAGLATYRWHHTPQHHPRNWHRARDRQSFGPDDIDATDRAGVPPFCKCWEEPLFV